MEIKQLVRKNIQAVKPYSSARDEFTGPAGVFLDANENPFGTLNRYPDPLQRELKQKLSELRAVPVQCIFAGNGSDEVLDLAFRIFCEPGADKALTFSPTYGMYEVSAAINNIELINIPLNASFQIDLEALDPYMEDERIKLIFICSPNNPTGNSIDGIEEVLKRFKGIVIVDEAYIDFSSRDSLTNKLNEYPNLIVTQTLSKAWGLAAARIGIAYAGAAIIEYLNKVKPPYNISLLNQQAALAALGNYESYLHNKAILLRERQMLETRLREAALVKKIYPSDANFLLVEVTNAGRVYNSLIQQGIITRNRGSLISNCIRITVGSPSENQQLLNALKQVKV